MSSIVFVYEFEYVIVTWDDNIIYIIYIALESLLEKFLASWEKYSHPSKFGRLSSSSDSYFLVVRYY